jgi:hypothetical protein
MSETSRRRRLLGRSMIAAGALALPLTASISYSVAAAQAPEPAEPVPPVTELAPVPAAPAAPDAVDAHVRHMPGFVVRHVGPDGKHTVREFSWNMPQPAPGQFRGPQPPQFHFDGDWNSEEFHQRMEQFQHQMDQFREKWGEQYGEQWQEWAENYAEHWQEWGERQREQAEALAERQRDRAEHEREKALARAERQREQGLAQAERQREMAEQARVQSLAWAEAARAAPVVVRSCGDDDRARTTTDDGRPRVVICPSDMRQLASSNLRIAREAIARSREISEEVRADVLDEQQAQIERIEHQTED